MVFFKTFCFDSFSLYWGKFVKRRERKTREKRERKKKNGSRGHRHRPSERVRERLRAIGEEMHETGPTRVHAHREQDGFWCVYLCIYIFSRALNGGGPPPNSDRSGPLRMSLGGNVHLCRAFFFLFLFFFFPPVVKAVDDDAGLFPSFLRRADCSFLLPLSLSLCLYRFHHVWVRRILREARVVSALYF